METTILLYSTPTCVYCKMTRQFFDEHKITYSEFDVAHDESKAVEMEKISGQLAVPVIVIEKEGKQEIVIGFDKKKLRELLAIKE